MTFLVVALLFFSACGKSATETGSGAEDGGRTASPTAATAAKALPEATYEVGCFGCVFHDERADGCQTAVKVGDEIYPVVGDCVPEAHSAGLCEAAHRAVVAGEIRDGEVHATKFELAE
jgi:hypothetical protein